jgi:hypothetical protein
VALGRSNHFKTSTDTRLQVSERLSIEQFQTFCTNELKYDGLVGPGFVSCCSHDEIICMRNIIFEKDVKLKSVSIDPALPHS